MTLLCYSERISKNNAVDMRPLLRIKTTTSEHIPHTYVSVNEVKRASEVWAHQENECDGMVKSNCTLRTAQ